MVWFVVALIVVATGVAMVAAVRIRELRLERTVRVEITNRGNVSSRYQVRVQDPTEVLSGQFLLDGDPLPGLASFVDDPEDSEPAQAVGSVQATSTASPAELPLESVEQAQAAGSGLARMLSTLGSSLPRSVGGPLLQAANQLRQRQGRVRQVQWYSRMLGATKRRIGNRPDLPKGEQPLRRAGSQVWSETPSVRPGFTLAVDMVLRSVGSHEHGVRPFRVVSRSVSGTEASLVIEEGSVEIRGGFWARRFLPHAALIAAGAALLALVAGLASTGVL